MSDVGRAFQGMKESLASLNSPKAVERRRETFASLRRLAESVKAETPRHSTEE
jgi:hypothetical protein